MSQHLCRELRDNLQRYPRRTEWLFPTKAGVPMTYVRDQLGHSSIKITVDVYGHLLPGSNKLALDRLEDLQTRRNQFPRNRP